MVGFQTSCLKHRPPPPPCQLSIQSLDKRGTEAHHVLFLAETLGVLAGKQTPVKSGGLEVCELEREGGKESSFASCFWLTRQQPHSFPDTQLQT